MVWEGTSSGRLGYRKFRYLNINTLPLGRTHGPPPLPNSTILLILVFVRLTQNKGGLSLVLNFVLNENQLFVR